MMTSGEARLAIKNLAEAEAKKGRKLVCDIKGGWTFCPVCSSRDRDFSYTFSAKPARDEKTGQEGFSFVFYIRHSKPTYKGDLPNTCLMVLAGIPAAGALADTLDLHGEALAVLGLEELMAGGKEVH